MCEKLVSNALEAKEQCLGLVRTVSTLCNINTCLHKAHVDGVVSTRPSHRREMSLVEAQAPPHGCLQRKHLRYPQPVSLTIPRTSHSLDLSVVCVLLPKTSLHFSFLPIIRLKLKSRIWFPLASCPVWSVPCDSIIHRVHVG